MFRIIFLLLFPAIVNANTLNVFFAGGQSNAKSAWVSGIEDALIDSNKYENILIVHSFHPGQWLSSWYSSGQTQTNYGIDFYNDFGTGALQAALSSPDTVFSGFFWFQGEGDTGSDLSMDLYTDKFNAMIDTIKISTLNLDPNFHVALAIIDAAPTSVSPLSGGRTMEDVNKMRQIQQELAKPYFFDTRGYERSDVFHLTSSALYSVGYGLGKAFLMPVPIPPAIFQFLSGLIGLGFYLKKKSS